MLAAHVGKGGHLIFAAHGFEREAKGDVAGGQSRGVESLHRMVRTIQSLPDVCDGRIAHHLTLEGTDLFSSERRPSESHLVRQSDRDGLAFEFLFVINGERAHDLFTGGVRLFVGGDVHVIFVFQSGRRTVGRQHLILRHCVCLCENDSQEDFKVADVHLCKDGRKSNEKCQISEENGVHAPALLESLIGRALH